MRPVAVLSSLLLSFSLIACDQPPPPPTKDAPAKPTVPPPGATPKPTTPRRGAPVPKVDIKPPEDLKQPPATAQKTASGLVSNILKQGSGSEHPGKFDKVKVHYTGWKRSDGSMFDSSVSRGKPLEFGVSGVIKGWTEGLQLMVEGEKRRLWIPAELAYGVRPPPGMPAGDLVFDVELLHIEKGPEPPETPKDLKAPPADAKKTASGLMYKVLKAGSGKDHPTATSRVTVHYSGWKKSDGEMFDSSVTRGEPLTFPLDRVIKGWQEGVQLMVEGEKTRFWIPSELAYTDKPKRPGQPAGDLVFDVELLKIQ